MINNLDVLSRHACFSLQQSSVIDTYSKNHKPDEFNNRVFEPKNIERKISNIEVPARVSPSCAVRKSLFDIRYYKYIYLGVGRLFAK
jgi:hypothetical protein